MAEPERIPVGPVTGPVVANVVAVIASFGLAVVTALQLPARYPVHWNAAGQPDCWAESGGIGWYAMPLLGLGLAAVMVALALLLPRIPMSLVNLPRKEQFLRLSVAERTPIIQYLIRYLLWLSVADTLLFMSIQWMMFRGAMDSRVGGSWVILAVASASYLVVMIWGIVVVTRMVREATDGLPPVV